MTAGPAMSDDDVVTAVEVGIGVAADLVARGHQLVVMRGDLR